MRPDSDEYQTIASRSEGLYKEKGSKFIGIAVPVDSEETVKEALHQIRKEYHDARHHCYAYCLGKNGEKFRANDDGEPNHSAGDPILGQIRSKELTNTLVVVVRYFGGTKLGVGGLISAYKTSAKEALDAATIVSKFWLKQIRISLSYDAYSNLMSALKEYEAKIIEEEYSGNDINLVVEVKESLADEFRIKFIG